MIKSGGKRVVALTCWLVTLALIITGICLGIIIPSQATESTVVTVSFDGRVSSYSDLRVAFAYVNSLTTTTDNIAVVRLQSDVVANPQDGLYFSLDAGQYAQLDLHGYAITCNDENATVYIFGALEITDSRPSAEHQMADGAVKGGVISGEQSTFYLGVVDTGSVVVNGGTLATSTYVQSMGSVTVNRGMIAGTVECYETATITINGGWLTQGVTITDGTTSVTDQTVIDRVIKVDTEKVDVLTDATTGKVTYREKSSVQPVEPEPITPEPDEPKTEQATNGTANMVGLIFLGIAGVSVIIGVTTIILVDLKKRK